MRHIRAVLLAVLFITLPVAGQANVMPDNPTQAGRYQTTLERGYDLWRRKQAVSGKPA